MTTELAQLKANPLSAIEIAVGAPAPNLEPQNPSSGIELDGVYSDDVTRFILKKARFSRYAFLCYTSPFHATNWTQR